MLTSTAAAPRSRAATPAYRPFSVTVARVKRLSPTFLRITFTGDELDGFGGECLDQRIKIVLPLDDGRFSDLSADDGGADWYSRWRELPDELRNPLRTYTSRAVRPHVKEVDVDFVCHGDTGPASRWARSARVGDPLVLIGPDANCETPGIGIEWKPRGAGLVLLAGDETAAPAICGILESLDSTARGQAFIEVPEEADILDVRVPEGVTLSWLPRSEAEHGSRLDGAVRRWGAAGSLRDSSLYAWLAGEAESITRLRRFLVREAEVDRSRVSFMGYWRAGRAES